jgi:hypothetical protein
MATVLDPASLTCVNNDGRRAVAFVSHPTTDDAAPEGVIQNWWLYCAQCVERFTADDFRVVDLASDLDPATNHPAGGDRSRGDGPVGHDPDPRPPTHPTTSP